MDYVPYSVYELHDFFVEPHRIAKDPYKLHAAYMLSNLFDLYDDDEDVQFIPEKTWGWEVDIDMLRKMVENANDDFLSACDNDLMIDIWNQRYSIRHSKDIDRSRLKNIFNFIETDHNTYIVSHNGIMNLNSRFASKQTEFEENKKYLEGVIVLAEDDLHNGWDKLTDMEITMYVWYLWCKKTNDRDYTHFRKRCSKDLYTRKADDVGCFNSKVSETLIPTTQYLFSASKVKKWNLEHHQKSYIK